MTAEPLRLGEISIGLSGGGTRAAGFHLGAFSYLERVGLLQDVRIISSASGGSIVNATYAMACARGWTFDAYLEWIIGKLKVAEMMEWVLAELGKGTPRNMSGRRSMVVALAEVYDRHFFEGFRLGELIDKQPGHLREVVINATDFRTGLGFRFQRHDPVGNGRTHLEPSQVRHVRLADVMAASSCLPGGLEPFFFPEDFVWEGAEAQRDAASIRARLRNLGVDAIPLMDGGIYDNQGLESLILAASRGDATGEDPALLLGEQLVDEGDDSQKQLFEFDLLFQRIATGTAPKEPPGLVIVSDTPLGADPVYRGGYASVDQRPLPTLPPPTDEGLTLGRVRVIWIALFWLCIISVLALGTDFVHSNFGQGSEANALPQLIRKLTSGTGITAAWAEKSADGDRLVIEVVVDAVVHGLPFGLTCLAAFMLLWVRLQMRAAMELVDEVLATEGVHSSASQHMHSSWEFLRHLRLSQVVYLAKLRASSLFSLANDVFFIRTRVLSYMLLYMMQGWREKLITNEIYDVSNAGGPDAPQPTEAMVNVVNIAAQLPTAFWFERPDDLPHLIGAGQMSICFNLISYLRRLRRREPEKLTPQLAALLKEAEADWQRLCADPHAFVPHPARPSVMMAAAHEAKLSQA